MAGQLYLRLLGIPQIEIDGQAVTEQLSSKAQALLYYLALNGQSQSRSTLAPLLWGDVTEAAARANLRRALVDLRRVMADFLDIERNGVAFKQDRSLEVDALDFETMVAQALAESDMVALQSGVTLYSGDFLRGFYVLNAPDFESWQMAEQARLRELAVQALHTLASYHAALVSLTEGITAARRLLALEPWREEAHRLLMTLLAQDGQRSAALAQYERCRQLLAEELGVEPGPETVALYEQIKAGEIGRVESAVNVPAQSPAPPHNLPAQATPFVGRVKLLNQVSGQLKDPGCRLLSLVGPGGMGKTRLALEAARQQIQIASPFREGVYFVNLTALTVSDSTPDQLSNDLTAALAKTLDFSFRGSEDLLSQVQTYLEDKRILLVLDNFEQLVSMATLLSDLLQSAPNLKVLVTSRERLNLVEEWVLPVEGLDFLPVDKVSLIDETRAAADWETYEAVTLFVQQARQVQANFTLSEREAQAVLRICQLVEGIPLALVLAASWLSVLSCVEIAAEIEGSLDFLQSSLRNMPARHRSVRAVFEQTWQRLSMDEQAGLSKLSVFKGGCLREAAAQVAGASLPLLASLVGKALLRRTQQVRYEMHELLRQFAAEKLQETGQTEATEAAHARYYGDFLHQREADLTGARQLAALAEINADLDNIRRSWRWAVEQRDLAVIDKSLGSFYFFCDMQGQAQEGIEAFRRAVTTFKDWDWQAAGVSTERYHLVLGALIGRQGFLAIRLRLGEESIQRMQESASILRQVGPTAKGQLAFTLHYIRARNVHVRQSA